MNTWDKLTQFEKAEVMKIALDNGIYNLDTIRNAYNEYAQGGSIHIDPSKKGTFTAAASKHNMGVQEFASKVLANKEDYSPAMVKKANFARNASKWHSYGGNLYDGTTENSQQMRNGKYFATNSRGDSYYLSPSALTSDEVNVTVPETIITANLDDVARGNAQRWWREHSNVYGEKGLEQVSPEFDLISLSPLVKPIVNAGLRSAGRIIGKTNRLANSPLTGNWTKIGNREYRLSPNSLGANGAPIESRAVASQITAENAASITPEQWTAAQDAAIARGDMAEAQRLRDLHFKVKTSGDTLDELGNPLHVYHGSPENNITEFYKPSDLRYKRPEGRATAEEGIYTSPSEGYASIYAIDLNKGFDSSGRVYDLYSNTKQMPIDSNTSINYASLSTKDANLIRAKGYNGITDNGEHVVLEPNQLKLADAVTYDDNGIRIPLGKRDNFNINDIRYGLLPLGIGLTDYGLSQKKLGGRIRLFNGG